MLRPVVVLVVALITATPVARGVAPQPQAGAAVDVFASAETAIRAGMQKAGIPGAAVAVVVGDRVVWTKGFGVANVETGAPVTSDTLFQIGSITKSFTAVALLSAASQGALALDTPVSNYVSGLTPCVGAPTLAQLLSHTGGLIDEPDEFGPQGEEGLGAYQRTWTREYCQLRPGRAFSYSNSGYALAGLALQEVDKQPFADVMKTRVLTPLGMTRTTFRPTEAMTWPLAVGHRTTNEGKVEVVRPLPNDARLWPAGTLYSTANEMARFLVALMNDGKVAGRQVLPAGVAARMAAAAVALPTTDQAYGLGMFVETDASVGHGGAMTGSVGQWVIEPQNDVAVVALTNGDGVNPTVVLAPARTAAKDYALAAGRRVTGTGSAGDTGTHAPLTDSAAQAYVGRYSNPRRFTVEVVRSGAALTLKRFGREFPMTHLGPTRFTVGLPGGGTETIAFGLNADGSRADYLQMNLWALARTQ